MGHVYLKPEVWVELLTKEFPIMERMKGLSKVWQKHYF